MFSMENFSKDKEIESLTYDLFHLNAQFQELLGWIKSDSTIKALRYMDKNPSAFDLEDFEYMNLLLLGMRLRQEDKAKSLDFNFDPTQE